MDGHKKDDPNFRHNTILTKEGDLFQLWKDIFSTMANYLHDSLHFSYLST
jgi:hypothetical protein